LEETAMPDANVLLARPLKAANPDAKHPGKARKIPRESMLSPGDYSSAFYGPEAPYLSYFPTAGGGRWLFTN
jgi:hypothetical protein